MNSVKSREKDSLNSQAENKENSVDINEPEEETNRDEETELENVRKIKMLPCQCQKLQIQMLTIIITSFPIGKVVHQ